MFYLKYLKRNAKYFLLDHKYLSKTVHYIYTLILCSISALVFTIGLNSMINLNPDATYITENSVLHLVTGGMSGLSQCLVMVVQMISPDLATDYQFIQSIFYFTLNIPLLIFSFFKLGWKFSVFTTINVILVSLFINILPPSLFDEITKYVADNLLARAMIAGVCAGISIATAFKGGHSAGGVDIIGYYLSVKKSTNAGKYIGFINIFIILTFSLLSFFSVEAKPIGEIIIVGLFSVLYQFMGSFVTDTIDVRNKKVLLQIITSNLTLSRAIIANVPHSCTIVEGKGGYTGNKKQIIYSVVSNTEVTKLVKEIRKIDDTSFINTMNLNQVYGRFYIRRNK